MNPSSKSDIARTIESVVETIFDKGINRSLVDPTRVQYLRISSFPFCARSWFLAQPSARAKFREEKASSVYFTSVGTAVHNCFQGAAASLSLPKEHRVEDSDLAFLPKNGLLVQDWVCTNCKARVEFTPHPLRCEWCGETRFRGDEHEVKFSQRVLGHMDGTFAFPHAPKAKYSKMWIHIPIDYKTCSAAAINAAGKLPYPENVDQLLSYGAIKQAEGFNIPAVALIYLCRDNPSKRKIVPLTLDGEKQRKKILKYEKSYLLAEKCRDIKTAMSLPVRATENLDKNCMYCKYKKACGEEQSGKPAYLESLVKQTLHNLKSLDEKSKFPNR